MFLKVTFPASLLPSLAVLLGAVQAYAQAVTPLDDLMKATQRNLKHLIQSGRYDEALSILQEKSRLGAETTVAWARDWVAVLVHLGRRGEARKFLQAHRTSGVPGLRSWATERLSILDRFFATEEARARYARGVLLMKEGRPGEAEPLFRGLMETEPDNLGVHLRLAQSLWVLGSFEAGEVIDRALEKFGALPELLLWRAETLLLKRQARLAVSAFETAVAANPRSERAILGLVRAQAGSGNKKQAIAILREHTEKHPAHVRALMELSRLSPSDQQKSIRLVASRAQSYLSNLESSEGDLGFPELRETVQRSLELAIKTPAS